MLGSFCLIKNEQTWIGPHLLSWLPFLDEMVFFDGNSTDDTISIIKRVQQFHSLGKKIVLVENKDPKNLQEDYERLSNECLQTLTSNFGIFLHPDMFPIEIGNINKLNGIAYFHTLKHYAGEPDRTFYEIEGRTSRWKNIMRLHNPGLGLHYHGHYGAWNEDMYFSEITGDKHEFHGDKFELYPYDIEDSGLSIAHFSDVRPYARRFNRMVSVLLNAGMDQKTAEETAIKHPRVTLISDKGFKFNKTEYPDHYVRAVEAYRIFKEKSCCLS